MGPSPKVLVIRLSSLGDVILATSVPAALKSVLPGSQVAFLTKEGFLDVLSNNPGIDRPIGLAAGGSDLRGVFALARELRAERFDLVVDLQVNPRTLLLSALIRPRKYTRAAKDSLRRHAAVRAKSLLSRRCRHSVQRYLYALEKLFGPVPALMPRIFLTDSEAEVASQWLVSTRSRQNGAIVAVCPGARWKTKVWGADKMALLAKNLVEAGHRVFVLGGPADDTVLSEIKLLCGCTEAVRFYSGSLRNIAALMAQCQCVVSNDSGLMHMSYSVGTPVVAIFGSTVPEFGFYPPDARSTVVSKSFRCKPCDVHGKDKCEMDDFRCMDSITVCEIVDAVDATLKTSRAPGRHIETPRFLTGEGKSESSRNEWSVPRDGSIVARVPNWVGDLVMALPTLGALRKCAEGRKFAVLAHERVAGLLERAWFVDQLIILRDRRGRGFLRAALALRAEKFSLGVSMPDSFSSAFLFWLGGVKRIVGFKGEMRDMLLKVRLSKQGWSHLSEQYSQLLPSSCEVDKNFVLTLDSQDTSRAGTLLQQAGISAGSRLALVAPGASYGETKRWPEDNYVRLVELLSGSSGFQVALVGSMADRTLCSRIARKARRPVADLSGRTNLRDLAAAASSASIFVGNDSGAAHVTALAGCPTVVIIGSSDPSWTAPRGEIVRTIYERVSCSPCFLSKCPYELQCLTRIDPDRVYRVAIELSTGSSIEPGTHSNSGRNSDRDGGSS